jgi:hypothetical protein
MVSMMQSADRPRSLTLMWIAALLAPVAWSIELGIMYSLTNETCMSGSRTAMLAVAAACVALAIAPAVFVWPWRRTAYGNSAADERRRLFLDLAIGGSLIFAVVTILSAVPIFFLESCRT